MSNAHKTLDLSFIEKTLKIPTSNLSLAFDDIVVDSRKVKANSLFIALTDGRRDGHDFIEDAIARGAGGIICEKNRTIGKKAVPLLECDDTMKALVDLAHAWRRQFTIALVAVVGSVGKTSTKEILAAVLAEDTSEILKTSGNENGDIGLPLTLLRLRSQHKVAVVEIGIDAPGAMERHVRLAEPTAAICTAISPEHMENFADLEAVAREELIGLVKVAERGGIVAVNCDDPFIRPLMSSLAPDCTYGFSLDGPSVEKGLRVLSAYFKPPQTLCIMVNGKKEKDIFVPLPGMHNARNTLGAITLGLGLGRSFDQLISGLESAEIPSGRCETYKLSSDITVICDYYNASPAAMVAGIETLLVLSPSGGRKIACLADMLELGKHEETYHRDLATNILHSDLAAVLTYGQRMNWLYEELVAQRFDGLLIHCESRQRMTTELDSFLKAGDTVLLKGSRSMAMEEVWEGLKSKRNERKF